MKIFRGSMVLVFGLLTATQLLGHGGSNNRPGGHGRSSYGNPYGNQGGFGGYNRNPYGHGGGYGGYGRPGHYNPGHCGHDYGRPVYGRPYGGYNNNNGCYRPLPPPPPCR